MKFFLKELIIIVHKKVKCVLLENKAVRLDVNESNLRVYSFQVNTKLYAKHMNAIFGDQLHLIRTPPFCIFPDVQSRNELRSWRTSNRT